MFHKCNRMPNGIIIEREKTRAVHKQNEKTIWVLYGYNIKPEMFYCPYCGKDLNDVLDNGKWTPPQTGEAQ